MKWLQGMLAEVDKVTELTDADSEVDDSLLVVGSLPEHLRKLFSYCSALGEKIKELKKEADETDSRSTAAELRDLVYRMKNRKSIAAAIMWEEIKFEFKDQLDPKKSLTLCKGWVLCMRKHDLEIPSLLRGLLGNELA